MGAPLAGILAAATGTHVKVRLAEVEGGTIGGGQCLEGAR